jgi:hypothetical protein
MLDSFFGLGNDSMVDSLIVAWPSGQVNRITNLPVPGSVTVDELGGIATDVATTDVRSAGLGLRVEPNPSSGKVVFHAAGRTADPAVLEIVDTSGRRVHRSAIRALAGDRIAWNGLDDRGRPVAAGVYYARLREGDRETHAKFVVVK